MRQEEIDEISGAFSEAWEEFFGMWINYVPMGEVEKHPVYQETLGDKKYLWEEMKGFFGTFKEDLFEESTYVQGRDSEIQASITFVTKELYDAGVTEINSSDIILIKFRNGAVRAFNIYAHKGKVQLGNNKVFTELKVAHLPNLEIPEGILDD